MDDYPTMKYWHRPRFWLTLIASEMVAFFLSAALATGIAALLVMLGMHEHHMGTVIEIAGPVINLYLGYSAFCYVRDRATRWPQPQGQFCIDARF